MKHRTLLLAIAFFTSALAPLAAATSVDAVNWGAPGAPVDAAPGDTGVPISISIRNSDTSRYIDVHAILGAVDGVTPVPGGDQSTLAGTFGVGDVWVAKFYVNIAPTATVGTSYQLPIELSLRNAASSVDSSQSITASIQLTGRPNLVFNATPSSLVAGQDTVLHVAIVNVGDAAAGSVTASLAPAAGSTLTLNPGATTLTLGGLAVGASREVTLRARAATAGPATLSVALAYKTASGAAQQVSGTVSFDVASASSFQNVRVVLQQDRLDSGRPGALTFDVTNAAGYELRDLVATLAPPTSATTAYTVRDASDVQSLGALSDGANALAKINVITSNSATGLQRLTFTLSWKTPEGTTVTQAYNFGIAILGTIDFQVSGTSGSFDATSAAGAITGTLTNLGNAIAHNTYISLGPSAAYGATQEIYLGEVNPNSALPFTLPTTLNNLSLLTAGGGGGGRGAFPSGPNGGAPPNGTFPSGGAPNGNGPPGGGFRNGTRGGFGLGGASNATFSVRWNDEYGATHSAVFSIATPPRVASAATTGTRGASTASTSGVPVLYVILGGAALAAVAIAAIVITRRRRFRNEFEE